MNTQNLIKTIEDAKKWMSKYHKFKEEGPLSGISETEIFSEKQQINCLFQMNE